MNPDLSVATVSRWLQSAQRVVALTGAGISTDSGIPDFRGPQGLWTRNPAAEKQSNIHDYMADTAVRQQAWQTRLQQSAANAQPNDGHRALTDLDRTGKLLALITQNIDGLHQIAGSPADKVIEVHGTMRSVVCMSCGQRTPMPRVLERIQAGEADPSCPQCGGILKSATISFGQALAPGVFERAESVVRQADLLLALGSTLQVYPVAGLVPLAAEHGARIVIINAEPTVMDNIADVVLHGSISQLLPSIIANLTRP